VLNGEGLNIRSGIFGGTFFMLTGFHGLHVLMGIIFLNVVYGAVMRGRVTHDQQFPLKAASWYWHFVDAVWICVFSVVYLWK
jgi:cytochrome c oxidase subunit 3